MHPTRLQTLIVPIAIVAVLGFSACGGDEEEAIPLADWIEQADEICRQADNDLDQEIRDFFDGQVPDEPSTEQLSQVTTEVLTPNFQAQHDAIADLPPPEERADEADQTLDALQEGIDELREDPSQIAAGGGEGPAGFQEATRLAGEIGLEECVQ